MPKKSGFTLVELLITISIIAILAVIGMVAYSAVLKQGRDSKRQSDLRSIQSALEQYHADQFYYPILSNATVCPPTDGELEFGCVLKNPTGNRTYLNTVPTGSPVYVYTALPSSCDNSPTSTTKCTSYCLYAKLENLSSPAPLPSGCTYPPGGYNFAVTPP